MLTNVRRAGEVAWALVGLTAVLVIVGVVAMKVKVIFPPLVLAGAIVFLLNPIVTRLQHRGIPRAAGAALSYLGVLAVVSGSVVLLAPIAADQVDQLADDYPSIQAKLERWVDDRAAESTGTIFEFSRQDIDKAVSSDGTSFEDQLRRVRKIGGEVAHVLLILVLGPIIGFYLLVDVPHMRRVAESLIPPHLRHEALVVGHRLNRAIGGFFRGQLVVAAIVGVLCSVGLAAIGLKFWFIIGMIAGLFNVIPLVGPWVGGVPGVTIALTTGSPVKALLVVAVMVGVQQIDNHFITPQVMQRTVQLHPAVVILALVAGGSLGGFFGLLLAVPVAAVVKILLGHVWRVYVLGEPIEPIDAGTGPGPVEEVGSAGEPAGAVEGDREDLTGLRP